MVSEELALSLGSQFVLQCAKSGKLELLAQSAATRDALFNSARQNLGLETRAALTTTDIPLPIAYSGELRALPQLGSIAMPAAIPEGSPGVTFAALESHKIGGLVRVPREIEEQSIVPMGQFLARYGAVEFARIEDYWGFLADGSATYEQVKGIVKVAT